MKAWKSEVGWRVYFINIFLWYGASPFYNVRLSSLKPLTEHTLEHCLKYLKNIWKKRMPGILRSNPKWLGNLRSWPDPPGHGLTRLLSRSYSEPEISLLNPCYPVSQKPTATVWEKYPPQFRRFGHMVLNSVYCFWRLWNTWGVGTS